MKKVRIYELAKELGVPAKKIISELSKLNIEVKSHMASIDGESLKKVKIRRLLKIKKLQKKLVKVVR